MDSGPVQGLVGIDVPHSRQKMLVQEERFDFPTPRPGPGYEFGRGNFQRLGAQTGKETPWALFFSPPRNPPKPAGVDEAELVLLIQEGEDQVGVFFPGGTPGQKAESAAHPQMNEHGAPAAQTKDDILSPPIYCENLLFSQQAGERALDAAQAFLLVDFHPGEFPPDDSFSQPPDDCFHFG
jgi:hypothetical protein